MKNLPHQYAVISAGILLLITALDNAQIMFTVSVAGILIGLGFLRKDPEQNSVMAITVGFFLTMIIAVLLWLKK